MREPTNKDTLNTMVEYYHKSAGFAGLKTNTQKSYTRQLKHVCLTPVQGNVQLGNVKLKGVSIKHLTEAYEKWLVVGKRTANYRAAVLSVVFKYAMRREITDKNPVSILARKVDNIRSIKWSRNDVKTFLDVAYSNFKWRSIGLISHMSYDWGQRIGDIRKLKWSSLDLDNKRVNIVQSKTGTEVHLPITDTLTKMLRQQQEDFGFQEYVAPRVRPIAQSYTHYKEKEISALVNAVKAEANLPKEITARDLRRTAITEMAELGVDLAGILQVSGHKSPSSAKRYLVNTYSGAVKASEGRNLDER